MKKERSKQKLTKDDYDKFPYEDTRHYGLFYSKNGNEFKVKIDPKRFCQSLDGDFSESVIKTINARKTHYFYPRKNEYYDYNCNVFETMINDIKDYWNNHYQSLITIAKNRIEKPKKENISDNMLFIQGIIDYDEANEINRMESAINQHEYEANCKRLVDNLYASFIHHMASQIESVTVYVLDRENAMKDIFNRNMLYSTTIGKKCKVAELSSFRYYDMLYCLWNFIKHNSMSTYDKLKANFSELIYDDLEYKQGIPAFSFIKLSDELIISLLEGCSYFFKEYCKLVFDEDYEEAQWNYGKFFYNQVREEIELITNPSGLPFYL